MDQDHEIWSGLTRKEVYQCLPPGTLSSKLRKWEQLKPAILQLLAASQALIQKAAAAKEQEREQRRRQQCRTSQSKRRRAVQSNAANMHGEDNSNDDGPFRVWCGEGEYMQLPGPAEARARISRFLRAAGNEALKRVVCVICARELLANAGTRS